MLKRQISDSSNDSTKRVKVSDDEHAAFLKNSTFEVYYMDNRGRAELPRLLLEFVGAKYVSRSPTDWKKEKKTTPFGRLPILTHFKPDGSKVVLPEVMAFTRYIAKLYGLAGDNIEEEAFLDMFFSAGVDNILNVIYAELWSKPDPTDPKAIEKTFEGMTEIFDGFESYLAKNGSNGYVIGEKPTYAEFPLFDWLEMFYITYPEHAKKLVSETVRPACHKVYQRLATDSRIRAYIDGGRWKFRPSSPLLGLYSSGIFGSDWEQSYKFYTEVLGLQCVTNSNPMDPTDKEPQTKMRYLEFVSDSSNSTRFTVFISGEPLENEKKRTSSITFHVKSVKDTFEQLSKAGVKFTMRPSVEHWGSMAEFADPDGNIITITERSDQTTT